MMAVSLPTGFLNKSDTSMENANEGIHIYGSEEFLHNISKESMDQIRKTMLKHEELFKEQVQMLHYLYNMQKSVMQDIRKAIYSQAQVLAFDSDTISDQNYKLHTFNVDGKPLWPANVAPQNLDGSHVLSHDPSYAVKGFPASSPKTSFWINDVDAKTVPNVQSKPRIEIDLERPPEDYMDDIEIQAVVNSCQEIDTNISLTGETHKKALDSHLERDLSDVKVDGPNLEQTNQRTLMSAHPEPSQGIHQCCEQVKETKILEAPSCKSSIGNPNLHKAFKNQTKGSTSNHLPAAGHPLVYKESKLSQQGNLTFAGQRSQSMKDSFKSEDQDASPQQVKGSCNSSSSGMCQSLKIECVSIRPLLELDEQDEENSTSRGPLPSNAVMCPQSSSIHQQHDLKKLSNFCVKEFLSLETNTTLRRQTSCTRNTACQRSENGGEVDRNYSNHKCSSTEFLEDKVHKDSGDGASTLKSNSLSGVEHGESAQVSQFEAGVQSEHVEAARAVNIGIKSFFPSYDGVTASHRDHDSCSNIILQTKCGHGEPTTPTKSREETRDEPFQEEASESIAARILLSFMPDSRSKSNAKGVTHMEAEPTRTNIDVASHERKRSLRARRTINYYDGGVVDETLKWTRSLQGRRTLRRH